MALVSYQYSLYSASEDAILQQLSLTPYALCLRNMTYFICWVISDPRAMWPHLACSGTVGVFQNKVRPQYSKFWNNPIKQSVLFPFWHEYRLKPNFLSHFNSFYAETKWLCIMLWVTVTGIRGVWGGVRYDGV